MPEVARRATVGAELAAAGQVLAAAGVPEPDRAAAGIWAGLEGRSPGSVWLQRAEHAGEETIRRFRKAVERRARGEPLAYVLGRAAFRTIELAVDSRVLIPRPETEGLVDQVLAWGEHRGEPWGVAVDVGTGSGAVALSLAVEGAFTRVIATDLSAAALAVASANRSSMEARVRTPVDLRLGSVLEPVSEMADVIVSNPPYLTEAEFAALDADVRDYEPSLALVGGADGLAPTRALLVQARDRLRPGGLLAVEVDSSRAETVQALARKTGWASGRIAPDVFGRSRYFLAGGGSE